MDEDRWPWESGSCIGRGARQAGYPAAAAAAAASLQAAVVGEVSDRPVAGFPHLPRLVAGGLARAVIRQQGKAQMPLRLPRARHRPDVAYWLRLLHDVRVHLCCYPALMRARHSHGCRGIRHARQPQATRTTVRVWRPHSPSPAAWRRSSFEVASQPGLSHARPEAQWGSLFSQRVVAPSLMLTRIARNPKLPGEKSMAGPGGGPGGDVLSQLRRGARWQNPRAASPEMQQCLRRLRRRPGPRPSRCARLPAGRRACAHGHAGTAP